MTKFTLGLRVPAMEKSSRRCSKKIQTIQVKSIKSPPETLYFRSGRRKARLAVSSGPMIKIQVTDENSNTVFVRTTRVKPEKATPINPNSDEIYFTQLYIEAIAPHVPKWVVEEMLEVDAENMLL